MTITEQSAQLPVAAAPVAQPAFLIEMSHQLRHIIMKRAYFLRGARARTMFCREKIAGKSWLEVTLAEKGAPPLCIWDAAHMLADKVRAELKADVFVEPAEKPGRHHHLITPKSNSSDSFGSHSPTPQKTDPFSSSMGISGMSGFGRQHGGGSPGMSSFGAPSFGMPSFGLPNIPGLNNIPGLKNVAGMPSVSPFGMNGPNSNDFLPAQVREALSFGESQPDEQFALPALRELPAFGRLPETTQYMFEVEALQILRESSVTAGDIMPAFDVGVSGIAELSRLRNAPGVSRRLKAFLESNL